MRHLAIHDRPSRCGAHLPWWHLQGAACAGSVSEVDISRDWEFLSGFLRSEGFILEAEASEAHQGVANQIMIVSSCLQDHEAPERSGFGVRDHRRTHLRTAGH